MDFLLDENVPVSVSDLLEKLGHATTFIRDYVPAGSPDPLVAAAGEELGAVLVTFDGDFQRIAPRIPLGNRARFRRLSRIWLRCNEWQAAQRLEKMMALVESEYILAQNQADQRMQISVGNSFIRIER